MVSTSPVVYLPWIPPLGVFLSVYQGSIQISWRKQVVVFIHKSPFCHIKIGWIDGAGRCRCVQTPGCFFCVRRGLI